MAGRGLVAPGAAPEVVLALECATAGLGAALWVRGTVAAVHEAEAGTHHAETVLGCVEGVLAQAALALDDVDGFALAIGPGSFTSLRVGLATVKGLAFGDERPIAGISTLEAVALPALGEAEHVAALLDARRAEFYAAAYRASAAGESERVFGEEVCAVGRLAEALPADVLLVGEALASAEEALRAAGRRDVRVRQPAEAGVRAEAVARIGARMLANGQGQTASELTPRYLRRPEAEEKRLAGAP